jgi:hypothetical protein
MAGFLFNLRIFQTLDTIKVHPTEKFACFLAKFYLVPEISAEGFGLATASGRNQSMQHARPRRCASCLLPNMTPSAMKLLQRSSAWNGEPHSLHCTAAESSALKGRCAAVAESKYVSRARCNYEHCARGQFGAKSPSGDRTLRNRSFLHSAAAQSKRHPRRRQLKENPPRHRTHSLSHARNLGFQSSSRPPSTKDEFNRIMCGDGRAIVIILQHTLTFSFYCSSAWKCDLI